MFSTCNMLGPKSKIKSSFSKGGDKNIFHDAEILSP